MQYTNKIHSNWYTWLFK